MLAAVAFLWWVATAGAVPAFAQLNTRLLLTSGTEVPGHGGLNFGPFLSLEMNGNQDIIFLTSLHSPRVDLHAVVRSTGVSFSVVAFQGLLGPFPRTTYDNFSAPSMNDSGVMAFAATLETDQADVPTAVVVRQEGTKPRAVVTNLDAPPGLAGAKFEEFSAPLVISDGSMLFGARWSGKGAGSGLFLWSARGLQALPLPAGLQLSPKSCWSPSSLATMRRPFCAAELRQKRPPSSSSAPSPSKPFSSCSRRPTPARPRNCWRRGRARRPSKC